MKLKVIGISLIAMVFSMFGFAQDDKPVKIILVAHAASAWDGFWKVVEQGNRDAATALNVDLTILAPDEWCPECVAQLIDQAVAAQPDAIGVTISDGVLFQEPMQRAIDSGVPVIAYNSADWRDASERIPYRTYIGQDEYAGGYQGAQRMIAAGATKGVCVNQAVGAVNLDTRCKGVTQAFEDAGFSAEVLGIGNDAAEATTTISDYYAANPDVDAFMTLGPNGAIPFYSFMEAEGLATGDVIHGTFDLGPEIVAHIKDGSTLFGIDQQPYIQGYLAVQWLTWMVRYNLGVPGDIISTGPGFVDSSNVAAVESLAGTYR